ncbi:MAG: 30S ribosomal protein S18 [Dehalococcoidia bacterium]
MEEELKEEETQAAEATVAEAKETQAPPPERPRRRRFGRRRVCPVCSDGLRVIDYKEVSFLRRFISDRGRIEPRRRAGTCAKHQRAVAQAIKRARHLALLPYTPEHIRRTVVPASR